MTGKQIIIYKKECYNEPYCSLNQVLEQLKAKEQECETLASQLDFEVQKKECLEQECEELKEQCKKYGEINEQETKDYAELKAENEELKQFLSKEPLAIQALQSAYSDYKKRSEVFFEMIKEYKQTLAEIKEIVEFYNNSNMDNICYQDGIYEILQKISEVEDG